MRLVLALFLLGACGAGSTHAPAWPKTAEAENDGGESIAPRQATTIAASDTPDAPAASEAAPMVTPTAAPATVTPTTPTIIAPEETITIEETTIVIEVEDD
jgi:hypothetical protein